MNRNKGVLMNTRFEKSVRSSDEWYTPKEVLKALGRFDLDPCAPVRPLWPTAEGEVFLHIGTKCSLY